MIRVLSEGLTYNQYKHVHTSFHISPYSHMSTHHTHTHAHTHTHTRHVHTHIKVLEVSQFVQSVNQMVATQEETERVKEAMNQITGYNAVEFPSELKEVTAIEL